MLVSSLHSWDLTPKEAVALQRELAGRVEAGPALEEWKLIAGGDISYNRFSPTIYAAVVVLRRADMSVVEVQTVVGETSFPYIPGLLSFRESPILLEAFAKLKSRPDVVMLDGHGYAHPRRFGYACHVGLCLGVPTLGCAKSRLIGVAREPGKRPGCAVPLRDNGETIGKVVRTRLGVRPVFASVGNHIDLDSAVRVVLASCNGYRIPEPTRQAHLAVNALRREYGEQPALE
jgi:deoxyribonuclease V